MSYRLLAAAFAAILLGPSSLVFAQSAPIVSNTFAVRLDNSVNDGNFATGDILYWGANSVTPSTSPPSYGTTFQCALGSTCPNSTPFTTQALFARPFTLAPDQWFASRPYDSSLTGSWNLRVSSSPTFAAGSTSIVQTPAVGLASAMPFVTSMTVQGAGLTPAISWYCHHLPAPSTTYA